MFGKKKEKQHTFITIIRRKKNGRWKNGKKEKRIEKKRIISENIDVFERLKYDCVEHLEDSFVICRFLIEDLDQ